MKKDTEENWTQSNPLLLDGELILVNTSDGKTKIKIGNGTDTYTNLSFLTLENESSQQDNCPFPINSLFIGADTTNPSTYWPSTTWEMFGQGKTLIGLDTGDADYNTTLKTGGAKTISLSHTHSTSGHTLTTAEMPSHSHSFGSHSHSMTHSHSDTFSCSSAGAHDHNAYGRTNDEGGRGSFRVLGWKSAATSGVGFDISSPYFDQKSAGSGSDFGTITVTYEGEHYHSIGISDMNVTQSGSHTHSISGSVSSYSGSTGTASGSSGSAGSGNSHSHGNTGSALGSQSIVQSYITVCFWRRTA